ncbi:hypothetical protein H2200_009849 [Cladophialophora chaetospira]|uniref:MYND-type domain-containing protein n=1 Tax=Cladophialophora chaetospira TaxID=386627 RepID=A0AA38X399_9EURO|nr:hypothetical protein H2200_009849 [Cladophialophora chaetospira]
MAEPDPATVPICANCQKVPKISYCSAECQKAHWESHKADCKRLRYTKSLYQAGDIVNALWPIIRSQTKQSTVDKVQIDGNKVDFWETIQPDNSIYLEPLEDFNSDKKVVRAILDTFSSTDCESVYSVDSILQRLLAGSCSKIERFEVKAKNKKWVVTEYMRDLGGGYCDMGILDAQLLTNTLSWAIDPGDEEPCCHCIFRVRLRGSREHFALDIANARHGRFDTVIPWHQYVTERVARIFRTHGRASFSEHSKPEMLKDYLSRRMDLSQFCTFRMKYLLETWLHEQVLSYDTVVGLNASKFAQKLAELQAYAKEGMRISFRDATKSGDLVMQMEQLDESSSTRKDLQRERIALMERTGVLKAITGISNPFLFEVGCTREQTTGNEF